MVEKDAVQELISKEMDKRASEADKALKEQLKAQGIDPDKYIQEMRELHERRINELESSENFLYYDFQGWPVFKKTLRELLIELGATEKDGIIGFNSDNNILDLYPTTLCDDGMAYGIDEMSFTDAEISKDKDGNKLIHLWRDKKWGTENV